MIKITAFFIDLIFRCSSLLFFDNAFDLLYDFDLLKNYW